MPDSKPLQGRRIVLTRPRESAIEWRLKLESLGAVVSELPLIRVSKDIEPSTLKEVFQELGGYEWIIFTSVNGVKFFFEEFNRIHDDIRAFGLMRIAVVGEATAAAIREKHLRVVPYTGALHHLGSLVELPAEQGLGDGLVVDSDGCVWVALFGGSALQRFTPTGQPDVRIELPVSQVTSAAFGGS